MCSPIGHSNTKHVFVPNQEPASAWIFGNGPVKVATQGLFHPYLKTFVPPFLPTRLTAPGSPRMVHSWQCFSINGEQEGILYAHASIWAVEVPQKCHRGIFCELFTFSTSICKLFSAAKWRVLELRSTNMFFNVSWHFYDESEFIVASLSPLRGQSFLL